MVYCVIHGRERYSILDSISCLKCFSTRLFFLASLFFQFASFYYYLFPQFLTLLITGIPTCLKILLYTSLCTRSALCSFLFSMIYMSFLLPPFLFKYISEFFVKTDKYHFCSQISLNFFSSGFLIIIIF